MAASKFFGSVRGLITKPFQWAGAQIGYGAQLGFLAGLDDQVVVLCNTVFSKIKNGALKGLYIKFLRFVRQFWFELLVLVSPEQAKVVAAARLAHGVLEPERHVSQDWVGALIGVIFGKVPNSMTTMMRDISTIFSFTKGPGKTAYGFIQSMLFKFARFIHYLLADCTNPLLVKMRNAFDGTSTREYEDFVNEITGIYNGNADRLREEPGMVADLPVFYNIGLTLAKRARSGGNTLKELAINNSLAKLKEIQEYVRSKTVSAARVEPSHLFLAGPAGRGKSTMARSLARHLISLYLKEKTQVDVTDYAELDNYIFVRNPGKFWQGFSSTHLAVIYDDMWTSTNVTERAEEMSEYQRLIGATPNFPQQADVQDKRISYQAPFLIVCSNVMFPQGADREASIRRILPHVVMTGDRVQAGMDTERFTYANLKLATVIPNNLATMNLEVSNDNPPAEFGHRTTSFLEIAQVMWDNYCKNNKLAAPGQLDPQMLQKIGAVRHADVQRAQEVVTMFSELNAMAHPLEDEFEDAVDLPKLWLSRCYSKSTVGLLAAIDFVRTNLGWLVAIMVCVTVGAWVRFVYVWFNRPYAEFHVMDWDQFEQENPLVAEWSRDTEERTAPFSRKKQIEKEETQGSASGRRAPVLHACVDTSVKKLMLSVGRIHLRAKSGSVVRMVGSCFFPGGRVVVIPRHFVSALIPSMTSKILVVTIERLDGFKVLSFEQELSTDAIRYPADKRDLCWFVCDKLGNQRLNVPVIEYEPNVVANLSVCVRLDDAISFIDVRYIGKSVVKFQDGVESFVIKTSRVDKWDKGDCGELLIGRVSGAYKAVGMYIGADRDFSYFTPIGDVMDLVAPDFAIPERHGIEVYDLKNTFIFEEKVDCFESSMEQRARNDIVFSSLYRDGATAGPVVRLPADLSLEAEKIAMAKKDVKPYRVDIERLQRAKEFLQFELARVIRPCRVISQEEAISGRTRYGDLANLFKEASPGLPYKTWPQVKLQGRRGLFEPELGTYKGRLLPIPIPEFQQKIDEAWDLWKQKKLSVCVFSESLKVEKRRVEKVQAKKTRIFSASPLHSVINSRRAIAEFYLQFVTSRKFNALGIAPQTLDWNNMALKALECGDQFGAFDYSGFDATIPAEFLTAVSEIVQHFYAEEDRKFIQCSMEENSAGVCSIHGELFQATQGNRSGYAFTTMVNCLVNMLNYGYCKLTVYNRNPYTGFLTCFGDDFFYTDRTSPLFTPVVFQQAAAEIGFVMTAPDKGKLEGDGWVSIHELEFLQRSFTQGCNPAVPASIYLGPLPREIILDAINTKHKGATIEDEAMTVSNALTEACIWSESFALEILQRLDKPDLSHRSRAILDKVDGYTVIARTMARLRCTSVEDVRDPNVLSMFAPCNLEVQIKGSVVTCPTVYHAYAACLLDHHGKTRGSAFLNHHPRRVHDDVRVITSEDWDKRKYSVMKAIVVERAKIDRGFRNQLRPNVEYLLNVPDMYWGCKKGGLNMYGQILMDLARDLPRI